MTQATAYRFLTTKFARIAGAGGLVVALVLSPVPNPIAATSATAQNAQDAWASGSVDAVIEHLFTGLKSAKKPLPAWAFDLALRAYNTYKTYRNGQRVEEVERSVLFILQRVSELRDQLEADRELTDRELQLTRDLLHAYELRLADFTERVGKLEFKANLYDAMVKRVTRRACPLFHAYRHGRCVDVRIGFSQ